MVGSKRPICFAGLPFYLVLSFFYFQVSGQTSIAFQGFEGSPADNWAFTPPFQNNAMPQVPVGAANYGGAYARTGNFSCRIGGGSTSCGTGSANCVNNQPNGGSCNNNPNGTDVIFAPINVSAFSNVQVSVAYRTHAGCLGLGFDATDRVFFEVQLNGGAWNIVATINGSNDCVWTYNDAAVVCGGNPPVANPFVYSVPPCTETVAFRVRVLVNRSDEVLYVDDVHLTGTPGGSVVFNPIQIQHLNP